MVNAGVGGMATPTAAIFVCRNYGRNILQDYTRDEDHMQKFGLYVSTYISTAKLLHEGGGRGAGSRGVGNGSGRCGGRGAGGHVGDGGGRRGGVGHSGVGLGGGRGDGGRHVGTGGGSGIGNGGGRRGGVTFETRLRGRDAAQGKGCREGEGV